MLELMALLTIGTVAFAAVLVLWMVVKLIFRLLLLPLLLIKWLVVGVLFTVLGPILLVAGLLAALVAGMAVLVPLLPFLAVAFLAWLLIRANRQHALVVSR